MFRPNPIPKKRFVQFRSRQLGLFLKVSKIILVVGFAVALPGLPGASGNYLFENLPTGGDYIITVEKTDNPLDGVTTFDLVQIAKHILQIQLLTSPYFMLQAAVNGSGTNTTLDLVEIRKVILFKTQISRLVKATTSLQMIEVPSQQQAVWMF